MQLTTFDKALMRTIEVKIELLCPELAACEIRDAEKRAIDRTNTRDFATTPVNFINDWLSECVAIKQQQGSIKCQ